ncbi:MAG: hypothetical protein K0R54_4998 [Clostridiaceae bacterium]|jgi:uncharacterized membrane protein|nr:hypothetical protein [Clostridiaceae bacterium]
MNKEKFMEILKSSLGDMPQDEINDILYDYNEHFEIGINKGKTEEEICKELGDPRNIGKSYRASMAVERAEEHPSTKNLFSAVLAAIALGFFNLVIVLGPFLAVVGIIIGFFAASAGIFIAGIASVIGIFIAPFMPSYVHTMGINGFAIFFIGIGMSALGALMFIGVCWLAKCFYKLTVKYLNWNINIIKK